MNSRKINILAAVLIASVLLLTASIGTVYAYLSATTEEHIDTFIPADAVIPIVSVSTPQTGTATATVTIPSAEYPVYVRAAVVVNWTKGGVICATPKDATYSVDADGWTKLDELDDFYYYYNLKVNSLESEFEVTYTIVDGYEVQVQVIAQTIQAVGSVDTPTDDGSYNSAVFDAWSVNMP